MQKYPLTAVVDRCVSDRIDLVVEADSEQDAYTIARKALETFPDKHYEQGVISCMITSRIQQNAELMSLQEQEDEGAAES